MAELTRREREKVEHRRLVLEAAEEVFSRKGFHNATVQEIATLAEFSVGYLYTLFRHKTDLYVELIDMRVAEVIADVEERMAAQEGPIAKLCAAIEAKVDFFRKHQRFFLIFPTLRAAGRAQAPPVLLEKTERRYFGYLERLQAVFADGIRQGLIADVDPAVLVHSMEGVTNAAIAQWIHSGGKAGGMAEPEVLQTILFRGILAREDGR
jgi:AcrR family transcriptional regulator